MRRSLLIFGFLAVASLSGGHHASAEPQTTGTGRLRHAFIQAHATAQELASADTATDTLTESSTSMRDAQLNTYSEQFVKDLNFINSLKIRPEHKFLTLKEEATFEQKRLFGLENNRAILSALLKKFDPSIEGDVDFGPDAPAQIVAVSVGSSSTQVYSNRGPIGGLLVGSDVIDKDENIAGQLLRSVIEECKEQGISAPILVFKSLGWAVNQEIDVRTVDSEERLAAVVDREDRVKHLPLWEAGKGLREQTSKMLQNRIGVLEQLHKASKGWNKPVIMQPRWEKKTRLDNDWIDSMCSEDTKDNKNPKGVYYVDFGGGGAVPMFCQQQQLEQLETDADKKKTVLKSLRGNQQEFVQKMIADQFEASGSYQDTIRVIWGYVATHARMAAKEELKQKMIADAEAAGLPPPTMSVIDPSQNGPREVLVRVFQTGMARQQHEYLTILPDSTLHSYGK